MPSARPTLRSLERLCADYPDNRYLVSVLSRENQHELCVYARKFANLLPFGCWWFLNNPSIVEEMTRERLEMLGTSFIPQHSDARILEQLIYKWRNTRRTIAPILANAYQPARRRRPRHHRRGDPPRRHPHVPRQLREVRRLLALRSAVQPHAVNPNLLRVHQQPPALIALVAVESRLHRPA